MCVLGYEIDAERRTNFLATAGYISISGWWWRVKMSQIFSRGLNSFFSSFFQIFFNFFYYLFSSKKKQILRVRKNIHTSLLIKTCHLSFVVVVINENRSWTWRIKLSLIWPANLSVSDIESLNSSLTMLTLFFFAQ